MTRRGYLPIAGVLAAFAGGNACARAPETRFDLLAAFPDAELELDALDLGFLAADAQFDKRGWSRPEASGNSLLTWAVGGRSRLRLPLHSVGDKELRLRGRCHESLGPSLQLAVSLNDHALGSVTLTPVEQELGLVLPATTQVRGDNVLTLDSTRRREPKPGEADQRPLVAAFSSIEVRPLGWSEAPLPPHSREGRLTLPASSAAVYHVRVPPEASLHFEATCTEQAAARLLITLKDDEKGETLVNEKLRVDRPLEGERGLASWPGRLARLEVSNPSHGGLAEIRRLQIVSPAAAPAASADPSLGFAPNIVLYLVDTLRADRLGAYGHRAPTSPRFDAFTRESLLFEDAWAQASWTRPTVGSILTGLHPGSHGADREDRALPDEVTTLAEALKTAGYRTGAFVANHLVSGRFGFDQGFDHWNGGDESLYGAPAATLGKRALSWLDAGAGGPFFLYVHTLEPHSPYVPEPEHAAPFALGSYSGDRDTRALLRLGQLKQLPPEGLRFLESQYQGEIRQNDAAFGALLDGLRSRQVLERSLVLFTSDHGEELLDHGGTEHAKTLYQELLRVPLAVRLPGARRAGSRETVPVQQIDLMPTLLRLAGARARAKLPGRDLASRWLGAAQPETQPPLLFAEERFTVISKAAVRAGPWKLILNSDGEALWRAGTPVELYDLTRDPAERTNLLAGWPIAGRYLRQELDRFRELSAAARRDRTLTLTAQEQEQLRALGYVR